MAQLTVRLLGGRTVGIEVGCEDVGDFRQLKALTWRDQRHFLHTVMREPAYAAHTAVVAKLQALSDLLSNDLFITGVDELS